MAVLLESKGAIYTICFLQNRNIIKYIEDISCRLATHKYVPFAWSSLGVFYMCI